MLHDYKLIKFQYRNMKKIKDKTKTCVDKLGLETRMLHQKLRAL
jgi:hypothetical protein